MNRQVWSVFLLIPLLLGDAFGLSGKAVANKRKHATRQKKAAAAVGHGSHASPARRVAALLENPSFDGSNANAVAFIGPVISGNAAATVGGASGLPLTPSSISTPPRSAGVSKAPPVPCASPAGQPTAEPTSASILKSLIWNPNENPDVRLDALSELRQLDFKEPALAKVAQMAGKAYEELRAVPPKGRLGGRKEKFTQRDLNSAWVQSFRKNYLQFSSLVSPDLAALLSFYKATEYSYGAGMDYDPAKAGTGDRPAFEQVELKIISELATNLGFKGNSGASTPAAFLEGIVKDKAKKGLAELINEAAKVRPDGLSLNKDAKMPVKDLGESGAVMRPLDAVKKGFVTEVQIGDKVERIESAWRMLDHLYESVQLNLTPLLVGPTGTGKSASEKYLASANGIPHLSLSMKPAIGPEEMIGSHRPTPAGLAWKWGFLIKAMVNGDWVTLEEVNLAPSEVIEFLNEFLNSGFIRLTQFLDPETLKTVLPAESFEAVKKEGFLLKPHPRFRMFMTMNPDHYIGRNPISKTFANRTVQLWVPDYSPKEMELMLQASYGIDPKRSVQLIENVYQGMKGALTAGHIGQGHKDRYEVNLRTMLRSVTLYKDSAALYEKVHGKAPDKRTDLVLLGRSLWEAMGSMMRSDSDRTYVFKHLDNSLGFNKENISFEEIQPDVRAVEFDKKTREVVFKDKLLPVRMKLREGGSFVPPAKFGLPPTPAVLNSLYWMTRRLVSGENILLVGETAAGKTSQVQFLHRLLNAALYYTNLSSESASEELEGGYQPAADKPGKFQFVSGKLEQASQEEGGKGATVFIDEFNLNGMVETLNTAMDDKILVTPKGVVHLGPNTILVGAMNPPQYQGRNMLSPAVRGRYWEYWVEEPDANEASLRVGWRLKQLLEGDKEKSK